MMNVYLLFQINVCWGGLMRFNIENIPISGELFFAILLLFAIGNCYYRTINQQVKHSMGSKKVYKNN